MGVLNDYTNAAAVNAALNKGVEANKAVSELKEDLDDLDVYTRGKKTEEHKTKTPYLFLDGKGAYVSSNKLYFSPSTKYSCKLYNVKEGETLYLNFDTDERTSALAFVIFIADISEYNNIPNVISHPLDTIQATQYRDTPVVVPVGAKGMVMTYFVGGIEGYVYTIVETRTSQKTEKVEFEQFVQGTMDAAGNRVDSNYAVYTKLNTIVNDRYVISVNPDYYIILNYNGDNRPFLYGGMISFIAEDFETPIVIKKRNGDTISPSDNIGFSANHFIKPCGNGEYDVIIASNTATKQDKEIADIICDGLNDEDEFNCAVNWNYFTDKVSCKVLVLDGDYSIDKFVDLSDLSTKVGVNAITVAKPLFSNYMSVTINGRTPAHLPKNSNCRIVVNNHSNLDNDVVYTIFGAERNRASSTDVNGSMYDVFNLDMSNLFISPNGYDKNIICIDGIGFAQMGIKNIGISWNPNPTVSDINGIIFDSITMANTLIGIRGVYGSNRGKKNYIKNTIIVGMREGIALTGEHFILEDNLQHHCYYGFTVGNYPIRGAMEHPNIFIGNSVEQCYRMALLNSYGATDESTSYSKQTLIYIGGSVENTWRNSADEAVDMLPIKEVVKGIYRGRIESDRLRNAYSQSLFEDGSGTNMTQTIW